MADIILPIMNHYTNYAMSSDGIAEINSLTYIPFESGYSDPLTTDRLALVLIEPRLLDATGTPALRTELMQHLQRFKGDLRAEGLHSRFILANLYRGPVHKDGRIVLALRRFFREIKSAFTNLEGVILIGNFPEATLVRRVAWRPGFLSPAQLAIWTELISSRAEIVLGDLTGNWESIYRQQDFTDENITATPDAATETNGWYDGESIRNCEFTSNIYSATRTQAFRDAFYIDDAMYTVYEQRTTPDPHLRVQLEQAERNNEVDLLDRYRPNILARPDISVSRINAYHVAVNPNPELQGTDGHTFLDAAGNPQTVTSPTALFNQNREYKELFNYKDFDLERRLLISYFDRNHRFRNGAFSYLPFRGAVVSGTTDFNPDGYEGLVNAAASDFAACYKQANATLQEYVSTLKTPATLKFIIAHSDAHYSEYRNAYDVNVLTEEAGGPPLRWVYRSGQYVPSFEGQGGGADIFVHRALWHYDTLKDAGASLMIHGGCNVNSVDETQSDTYFTSNYAHWNNAEGILFYTNCVALFSRAKGFNDAPYGFTDGYRLADRANFGSCWKSYYNAQSNDAPLSTYNIQRKRVYFWSINGDWTLRIRNKNGIGLLGLDQKLNSVEVHPNRAWIDHWNFDAAVNRIRGIGDIDNDGIEEYVVNSEWGIGLLKYTGSHFRALMVAPRDTWFGGWRYDATVNPGRDSIKDVRNFTGNAKNEIMIWSAWGMSTLEYTGASLYPSRIYKNGTRLGGWLLNTADNTYCSCGKFDRDAQNDMVVSSPWGLGVLSLQNSSHVFMAPNGTRLGDWLLNSGDNTVRLVADLDGDGLDEIFITSPWGVGVLKMTGGALQSVAMHANGSSIDGYTVRNTHTFALADNLKSGGAKQIVAIDNTGIHILGLSGHRLMRVAFGANGTRVNGWVIDTSNNRVQRAGDMNGDGRAEFLIRSPWGIGIMGLDTANHLHCYTLVPYNTPLNDWYLQSGDWIVGAGNLSGSQSRSELLIVKP